MKSITRLLLALCACAAPLLADVKPKPAVAPAAVKQSMGPQRIPDQVPLLLEYSDVMFMTDANGQRFWQVRIDNKAARPAENVVVPAWLFGFLPNSEVPCHSQPVPSIAPGTFCFARGPLPLFPGAHRLRLNNSPGQETELPTGYRQDREACGESALPVDEFTVIETGRAGTVRFVVKTKVNRFEPIPAGGITLTTYARGRYRTADKAAFDVPVIHTGTQQSTEVISSGGYWTASGEITVPAAIAPTRYFDRVAIRIGSLVISKPVAPIHYQGCVNFAESEDPNYGIAIFEANCR